MQQSRQAAQLDGRKVRLRARGEAVEGGQGPGSSTTERTLQERDGGRVWSAAEDCDAEKTGGLGDT